MTKILVVDDEIGILKMFDRILSKEGYEIITTNSAKDVIDIISKSSIDIVFLDIMMPEIDGLSLLKKIKQYNKNISVIMMTGYATIENSVEAIKNGAENFLLKPFDKVILLNTIKNTLESLQSKKFLEQQEKFLKIIPLVNDYVLGKIAEKDFLNNILDVVLDFLNSRSGMILWYNESNSSLEIIASKNLVVGTNTILNLDTISEQKFLSITKPMLMKIEQRTDLCNTILPLKENESALILPIFLQNKICGTVNIIVKDVNETFLENNYNILVTLTNFLSFALLNHFSTKKLIEYNKLKSEFVSQVSHDLRTPIMAISGATELLETQETDNNKKNLIELIKRNINRMETLIKNLLDFSRIEVGEFKLKKDIINIVTLVKDVVKDFTFLAEAKKIKFITNFPKEPIEALVDQERLIQIISNLISNAIKFTPEGGTIKCNIEYDTKQQITPQIKIIISDTGVGISKEHITKIFDKFYQIKTNEPNQENKGYGIGLSVVKSLVEAHNGKIEVESEPNKGTTFFVYLPVTTN